MTRPYMNSRVNCKKTIALHIKFLQSKDAVLTGKLRVVWTDRDMTGNYCFLPM